MFCKEMRIFNPFLPNSKRWAPGVGARCSLRAIWH